MPYFHATTRGRLPSILRVGLWPMAEKNFDCENGVYLAGSPELALMFLIEAYTGQRQSLVAPCDFVDEMAVIVIDDCRIDPTRLAPDPQVEDGWRSWIYNGVIDVANAPILNVDQILAEQEKTSAKP